MSETDAVEKAFTYSRFAQRAERRDASLAQRVRATPAQRPPVAEWRRRFLSASADGAAPVAGAGPNDIDSLLRTLRRELMLRTVVRDLALRAPFDELVSDLSEFADLSIALATQAHSSAIFGNVTPPHGFSTVAMGKLGAQELNASSDIDIVFVCEEPAPDAMDNLNLLARRITRTLTQEQDGEFVFRVDTRLRPYGDAGPLVPTLDFLEQYFVAQGRMWERLAWLKARVAAGPLGADLAALTVPFVFRRYLDFDAVAGMRELHAQLRAEKSDPNNIKLGRGGIRELEFGTQLRQLVRGGRQPLLRSKPTNPALNALAQAGNIGPRECAQLNEDYRWLRRLEHALQYRDDQQTQTLPSSEAELSALAAALDDAELPGFQTRLAAVRTRVAHYFDGTLTGAFGASDDTASRIARGSEAEANAAGDVALAPGTLAALGYAAADDTAAYVRTTLDSARVRALPAASRERFTRLLHATLRYAARCREPDAACKRTLDLLLGVASRSSYLALMIERPQVLERVIDLAAASDWALRYVGRHPLLLDELMDGRTLTAPVDYEQWRLDLRTRFDSTHGDTERMIDEIRHFQQGETFRLLLKDIAGLLPLETLSDHLSALADTVVDVSLGRLMQDAKLPNDARLAVIAYGRWGGKELGYASDLDLIFLMPDSALEHREALTRVAQRLQSWLTTMTAAGRAYEIDVRLRPDGAAGLLLSTAGAFETYQREKAWTWEHQALTRARFAAGDPDTGAVFETIRDVTISRHREWPALREEIIAMRARVSEGHPNRKPDLWFDIKHDTGGLVDLEFAVQAIVLRESASHRALRENRGNIALAQRSEELGLVGAGVGFRAADAYRRLRTEQHAIRLRGAERAQVAVSELREERAAIRAFYEAAMRP
ncbi:MAG: bifunctional [glutamate--ammonia ligase]-adenylyl-L-tyrosine phosphorylase/[glutamate--ammonia-ligase] adenylyltransferase [Burkholderiales bacterium]|nr:bifunctional [glutamate--ammonia ligase]-adenylyl-L-tyrosine phosphorylase/[glutamate--ammonia-ligase] adenylyltransferase [Burkholderiales bacterium]